MEMFPAWVSISPKKENFHAQVSQARFRQTKGRRA